VDGDRDETPVEALAPRQATDGVREDDEPQDEIEHTIARYDFATPRKRVRSIPLSPDPEVFTLDAEPPPPRMADGSSISVLRAPRVVGEVNLRRNRPPSDAEVEAVFRFLGKKRMAGGTPAPALRSLEAAALPLPSALTLPVEPAALEPPAAGEEPDDPPRGAPFWVIACTGALAGAILAALLFGL
jgi:hypothetical protein